MKGKTRKTVWWESLGEDEKYRLTGDYTGLQDRRALYTWWYKMTAAEQLSVISELYGRAHEPDPRKHALYTILAV